MKSYLEKQRIFIQRENLFQSLLEFKACVWGHLFPNELSKWIDETKTNSCQKSAYSFLKLFKNLYNVYMNYTRTV